MFVCLFRIHEGNWKSHLAILPKAVIIFRACPRIHLAQPPNSSPPGIISLIIRRAITTIIVMALLWGLCWLWWWWWGCPGEQSFPLTEGKLGPFGDVWVWFPKNLSKMFPWKCCLWFFCFFNEFHLYYKYFQISYFIFKNLLQNIFLVHLRESFSSTLPK